MRADAAPHMKPVDGDIILDRHSSSVHLDDESLGAYVDGELSGWARQAAADHLRGCPACRQAAEDIAALGSAARRCESPNWDVEAMVALVDAGISRPDTEAAGMVRASHGRIVEAALGGSWAGWAAGWIRSHRRLALELVIAAIVMAVSALGIAGAAYRRELMEQDKVLVDSHYMVRSGNVGALLVSYPRR